MSLKNLVASIVVVLASIVSVQAAPAKQRPNIIFILTDDLDVGLFHELATLDALLKRPNTIDSLITQRGTEFSNHFVSLSLCCPSRTSILRGQYAHNTSVFRNDPPFGGYKTFLGRSDSGSAANLESSTIATWLHDAGYRTGLIGKYLNGYPLVDKPQPKRYTVIPPGWDYWVVPNAALPNTSGPYSEYFYALNVNGQSLPSGSRGFPKPFGAKKCANFLGDVLADHAVQFIRESSLSGRPFFLYLAPYQPHSPATPPCRYNRKNLTLPNEFRHAPRTASFNQAVQNPPRWLKDYEEHLPLVDSPAGPRHKLPEEEISCPTEKCLDGLYEARVRSMLAVDDLVADVMAALRQTKTLANTYVFFTSDNGYHQGQHLLKSGKNTEFEEDLRVPLVVRGPGIPRQLKVGRLTANVDFAPTFAELAGVSAPDFVDGRSLAPFLSGNVPTPWRKALLLEHLGLSVTPVRSDGLFETPDEFDLLLSKAGTEPNAFAGLRTGTVSASGVDLSQLTYTEYNSGDRELYENSACGLNPFLPTGQPCQVANLYDVLGARETLLSQWLSTLRYAAGAAIRRAEETPPQ